MLIFTAFDGSPVTTSAAEIDEVLPGAFAEHAGGCRLILTSGAVLPVMEDADSVESVLSEARLAAFGRSDAER